MITKEKKKEWSKQTLCQGALSLTPSGTFPPTVPEPVVTNQFTVSLSIAQTQNPSCLKVLLLSVILLALTSSKLSHATFVFFFSLQI